MLYIVWIWWLFRSEEIAVMLPLGTETCLAQEWLCKHTEVAVALSFAVILKLRWCCEANISPVSEYRGGFFHLSYPACASAAGKRFLKVTCFAGLFHTRIHSLRCLIWPALTQLCCKVRVSCSVWSLRQCEEFLQFDGTDQVNQPGNHLRCPEGATRKWKCNPAKGSVFLDWGVGREGC